MNLEGMKESENGSLGKTSDLVGCVLNEDF